MRQDQIVQYTEAGCRKYKDQDVKEMARKQVRIWRQRLRYLASAV